MIIACDVDGVVANLHTEWYRRYNRDWNDDLTIDRVLSWDLLKYVKPECGEAIFDYLQNDDLYRHVKPVDGALEGVAELRAMGHTLTYVSDCFYGMVDQKAYWLQVHGFSQETDPRRGALPADFMVCRDKTQVDAHLLIDDGAHNVRAWVEKKQRRAILVEFPHNRSLLDEVHSVFWTRCDRAATWPQILSSVKSLDR